MELSRFFKLFGITLLSLCGILYFLGLNNKMSLHMGIAYYGIIGFALLSLVVYFLTTYVEKLQDKQMLLSIVLINVMAKMLITVAVVAIYYNTQNPSDGIFVVPFIIVYVVFTIFETYFMSEQARTK